MQYILDVFKTSYVTASLGFIYACESIVSGTNNLYGWPVDPFDLEEVALAIKECLAAPEHPNGCLAYVDYKGDAQGPNQWLQLTTSETKAAQVVEKLISVVCMYDLVLLDRQNAMATWRKDNLYNKCLAQSASRASAIKRRIYNSGLDIFATRKIEDCSRFSEHHTSFVVALRHRPEQCFEERITAFHKALVGSLEDGEELRCEDDFFSVQGECYTVNFVLEGYKKASRMGSMGDDNQPQTVFLRRMGANDAFNNFYITSKYSLERMNVREFSEYYPNPADRLVASIAMERRLEKMGLGVVYGSAACGKDGVVRLYPFSMYDRSIDGYSYLGLPEKTASLVFPIIQDFYPYIQKRYNSSSPLPHTLWEDVTARMQEIARLVKDEPYHKALDSYVERIDIEVLQKDYGTDLYQVNRETLPDFPEWIKNRKALLYRNRRRFLDFFAFFTKWIERQGHNMIVIDGRRLV